jgi:hypothetical protein
MSSFLLLTQMGRAINVSSIWQLQLLRDSGRLGASGLLIPLSPTCQDAEVGLKQLKKSDSKQLGCPYPVDDFFKFECAPLAKSFVKYLKSSEQHSACRALESDLHSSDSQLTRIIVSRLLSVYRSGSLEQAAHGDLPVYSVSGPILRKR